MPAVAFYLPCLLIPIRRHTYNWNTVRQKIEPWARTSLQDDCSKPAGPFDAWLSQQFLNSQPLPGPRDRESSEGAFCIRAPQLRRRLVKKGTRFQCQIEGGGPGSDVYGSRKENGSSATCNCVSESAGEQ